MTNYHDMGEKVIGKELLGKVWGVDPMISFTVGTDEAGEVIKTYRNGPNGKSSSAPPAGIFACT